MIADRYNEQKVSELREECLRRGIATVHGVSAARATKADMVAALERHDDDAAAAKNAAKDAAWAVVKAALPPLSTEPTRVLLMDCSIIEVTVGYLSDDNRQRLFIRPSYMINGEARGCGTEKTVEKAIASAVRDIAGECDIRAVLRPGEKTPYEMEDVLRGMRAENADLVRQCKALARTPTGHETRDVAPTPEEIALHAGDAPGDVGGQWIVRERWGDASTLGPPMVVHANIVAGHVFWRVAGGGGWSSRPLPRGQWRPIDIDGNPVAWPVVE